MFKRIWVTQEEWQEDILIKTPNNERVFFSWDEEDVCV